MTKSLILVAGLSIAMLTAQAASGSHVTHRGTLETTVVEESEAVELTHQEIIAELMEAYELTDDEVTALENASDEGFAEVVANIIAAREAE